MYGYYAEAEILVDRIVKLKASIKCAYAQGMIAEASILSTLFTEWYQELLQVVGKITNSKTCNYAVAEEVIKIQEMYAKQA